MSDADDDRMIDQLLTQAAAQAPEPSADLMARVLADAQREQKGRPSIRQASVVHGPWRFRFVGWSALGGGLVGAMLTGIWLGYSTPAVLEGYTLALMGGNTQNGADFALMADLYLDEGT